jgi:hypothetical protein
MIVIASLALGVSGCGILPEEQCNASLETEYTTVNEAVRTGRDISSLNYARALIVQFQSRYEKVRCKTELPMIDSVTQYERVLDIDSETKVLLNRVDAALTQYQSSTYRGF